MMQVYVLGAGASTPDGVPITKELFKTAILGCDGEIDGRPNHYLISLGIFDKPEALQFRRLVLPVFDYLEGTRLAPAFDEHYRGWTRPFWLVVETPQIEDFFTKLYRMRQGSKSYGTTLTSEKIRGISNLANDLLFGTICRATPMNEESQPSYYQAFVNAVLRRPGFHCIISFNYDLLLDFQLAWLWKRLDSKRGVYVPVDELRWTYGITFSNVGQWEGYEGLPQEAKISYYKLHGSLNMSFDSETKAVSLHVPCGDHRAHRFSNRDSRDGQPLLIPPLLQKEIPPVLATLWEKAAKALSQAEEIHVIGYSAPEADEEARKLLKGSGQRRSIKRIIIANREVEHRNGLQGLMGASKSTVVPYDSFQDYLRRGHGADVPPGRASVAAESV